MKHTGGIAVVTVGLILAFAVSLSPPYLIFWRVGLILVAAGVAAMLIPEWLNQRRRRGQETSPPAPGPNGQVPFPLPRDIPPSQDQGNAGAQPGSGTGDDTQKAA